MTRACAFILSIALAATVPAVAHSRSMTGVPLQKKLQVTGRTVTVRYLLYLPSGYLSDSRRKWPFILFLHGSTEKGNDIGIVRRKGLPAYLEKARSFPFIVISPQLPLERERWDPLEMKALLDVVLPDSHCGGDLIAEAQIRLMAFKRASWAAANSLLSADL